MTDEPTILITGAADGIGFYAADQLAGEGVAVILQDDDQAKLDARVSRFPPDAAPARAIVADLSDLGQVRQLAREVRESVDRLDGLVNHAFVGFHEPDDGVRRLSTDGYELRFAVNHLAGFLLTLELLPLLRRSAPARVVNVCPWASGSVPRTDTAALLDDFMVVDGYSGPLAYERSRVAQAMSSFELATRLPAGEVTVTCFGCAYEPPEVAMLEIMQTGQSIIAGGERTARLVRGPELAGVTGAFYQLAVEGVHEVATYDQAYDASSRAELWRRSLELVDHLDIDPAHR